MKFDPFTVRVNPWLPAVADAGLRDEMLGEGFGGGGGGGVEPPPPQPMINAEMKKTERMDNEDTALRIQLPSPMQARLINL